ncbi:MAG TPA: hypothetical protein PLF22_12890 [Pseudomonadales bacterium]|nr:hypothetical protein [Pseudomonadales bacterium]
MLQHLHHLHFHQQAFAAFAQAWPMPAKIHGQGLLISLQREIPGVAPALLALHIADDTAQLMFYPAGSGMKRVVGRQGHGCRYQASGCEFIMARLYEKGYAGRTMAYTGKKGEKRDRSVFCEAKINSDPFFQGRDESRPYDFLFEV